MPYPALFGSSSIRALLVFAAGFAFDLSVFAFPLLISSPYLSLLIELCLIIESSVFSVTPW